MSTNLKVIHLLCACLFLGNVIVSGVWAALADRTGSHEIIKFSNRMVLITDALFTATGALGVVITGHLMADRFGGANVAIGLIGGAIAVVLVPALYATVTALYAMGAAILCERVQQGLANLRERADDIDDSVLDDQALFDRSGDLIALREAVDRPLESIVVGQQPGRRHSLPYSSGQDRSPRSRQRNPVSRTIPHPAYAAHAAP